MVATLKGRGVIFDQDITDLGYGFITYFRMPENVKVQLYEPKYVKQSTKSRAKRKAKPSKAKPSPSSRRKHGSKPH